ncbi:LytTR family transcriptional regulator DNA-binding domain-containing protein [Gorillibacterium timonense]|uniref:LytTR family transcriptional regulator DNA-binding domain-containing protein n=1 Tax=Gorillibacterium timonense TaxID=1689269 RepID=UPI00071DAF51|nr:LytTR family transcriptional regulator DNA-binding domain-containing protein [Gorillibacterium timonense]
MLEFRNVYKTINGVDLKDLCLHVAEGQRLSLECDHAMSDLLVRLILGNELQNRGSILLSGLDNRDFLQRYKGRVGVIFREDGFYSKMTVGAYAKFFAELSGSSANYREILAKLALLDSAKTKIHELNHGQRKRLALARERIKRPSLLLFQEPNLNMDRENMAILLENLEQLSQEGTCVVNMSVFFRDTLLMGGQSYRLDDNGLVELQTGLEDAPLEQGPPPAGVAAEPTPPIYRIEKIPARLEDRILLFDPMEIDYVESEAGFSALSVRGDRFPCALSMAELEERLRHFGFFRCHRSYLVNLQRLKEVVTFTRNSYSLSLDDRNKSSIPLSKGRLDELKEILKL